MDRIAIAVPTINERLIDSIAIIIINKSMLAFTLKPYLL